MAVSPAQPFHPSIPECVPRVRERHREGRPKACSVERWLAGASTARWLIVGSHHAFARSVAEHKNKRAKGGRGDRGKGKGKGR